MEQLNLPDYQIPLRRNQQNSQQEIFDVVRKKWLMLTAEEWVRQNFIHFLIYEKEMPSGLIAIEKGLRVHKRLKRTDILIYDKERSPLLVVECKAPSVKIDQKVFDQILNYNMALKVQYLVVTNGLHHYCCKIDYNNASWFFLKSIPNYKEL